MLEYVRQPDNRTCQSACVAQMVGSTDVMGIREELESIGVPGDPAVMGIYLKKRVKHYHFNYTASMRDMIDALHDGFKLITHGFFTNSGHVISVVGVEPDPKTLSMRFVVDDPYAEFDFPSWTYLDKTGNNVRYSSFGIFAACVASSNREDAHEIYCNKLLNLKMNNAWVHFIKN